MKKQQSRAPTTCIRSFFWDMGLLPSTKEVAKMRPWHPAWALLSLRYLTHQVASQLARPSILDVSKRVEGGPMP